MEVVLNNIKELDKYIDFPNKTLIVIDSEVSKYYLNEFDYLKEKHNIYYYILPSGEASKDIKYYLEIIEVLLKNSFSKSDLIIGVGGGVVGDVVGFVCATYKRGIPFILMPTTLLSLVDSSVGGKNGINYLDYKNMIGTINLPKDTFIYLPFLNTLDKREISSGLMEVLKMALLYDSELLDIIENNDLNTIKEYYPLIISKSRKIKEEVINKDLYDQKERRSLNFGHTIGHAIEESGLGLNHGECVGLGMIAFSSNDIKNRIIKIVRKYLEIDYRLFNEELIPILLDKINNDKKNSNNLINIVYLNDVKDFTYKAYTIDETKELLKGFIHEISIWN